jgi:hypothetical protein
MQRLRKTALRGVRQYATQRPGSVVRAEPGSRSASAPTQSDESKSILYRVQTPRPRKIDQKFRDSSITAQTLIQAGFKHIGNAPLLRQNIVIKDAPKFVPELQHGLNRVVTEPGLHRLRATSGAFNFSPFLAKIYQPHEVNFSAIPPFVTTSRDKVRRSEKI